MKRTIKFWTKEEDKAVLNCMEKFTNFTEASEWLSKKIKRTPKAIYLRMCRLNPNKSVKTAITKKVVKSIIVPAGTTFEGSAKKVELHSDHFRIYF